MAYERFCCEKCGGNLKLNNGLYFCPYCGSQFADALIEKAYKKLEFSLRERFGDLVREELVKREQERFLPLLRQLWDKSQEKYTDSKAIISICRKIKDIYPDNFIANFYEVANSGTVSQINGFLNGIDVKENSIFIEDIVTFMVKSLELGNVASLNYLIERAYKQSDLEKFEEYATLIETEANKVDEGLYNTDVPRDVFIAYSSKDIDKVLELVENIESQGLTCFIAMRNLRHGRGAKANYLTELQKAMKNCHNLVFVSSKNSRALNCDALKIELPFIKELDIANIPVGYKNDYTNPKILGYKKPRIEYRLDNEKTPFADIFLKEFFAGLEYTKSLDDTLERLAIIITNGFGTRDLDDSIYKEQSNQNAFSQEEFKKMFEQMQSEAKRREEERIKNEERLKEERRIAEELRREEEKRLEEERINALGFDIKDGVLVKYLGEREHVSIPDTVTVIGIDAFNDCRDVVSVKIPSTVTAIEEGAFSGCENLTEIEIPNTLTSIGSWAFGGCTSLKSLNLPNSITTIGEHAFSGCRGLEIVVIPESITEIDVATFSYCSSLTDVVIPNTVKSIGGWAFLGCESLINIDIPYSVETIGEEAFKDCVSLSKVAIPFGVTAISYATFYNCKSLSNIVIPDSVTSIDDWAFEKCISLGSIVIPAGVVEIANDVFKGCFKLTVYYDGYQLPDSLHKVKLWSSGRPVYVKGLDGNWVRV